jgi:hypothetical protein
MEMVAKYDTKFLISLWPFTSKIQVLLTLLMHWWLLMKIPYGLVTSNKVILHRLLNNELSLFHHLHVKPEHHLLPLTWWKSHELQFPNICFIARKILGILRS